MDTKIAKTESAINNITIIIIPAIENYNEKYEEYERQSDIAGGQYDPNDLNDPLTKALIELDEAKEELIEQLQALLTDMSGSYTGETIPALTEEISNFYISISRDLIPALKAERGDQATPAAGTLYAKLEIAKALKETAQEKLDSCGVNVFISRPIFILML